MKNGIRPDRLPAGPENRRCGDKNLGIGTAVGNSLGRPEIVIPGRERASSGRAGFSVLDDGERTFIDDEKHFLPACAIGDLEARIARKTAEHPLRQINPLRQRYALFVRGIGKPGQGKPVDRRCRLREFDEILELHVIADFQLLGNVDRSCIFPKLPVGRNPKPRTILKSERTHSRKLLREIQKEIPFPLDLYLGVAPVSKRTFYHRVGADDETAVIIVERAAQNDSRSRDERICRRNAGAGERKDIVLAAMESGTHFEGIFRIMMKHHESGRIRG